MRTLAIVVALVVLVGGAYYVVKAPGSTESGGAQPVGQQEAAEESLTKAGTSGSVAPDKKPDGSPFKIRVPAQYQFAGITEVEAAESTDELLAQYLGGDLEYLIEFYRGFTSQSAGFDVLDFRSRRGMEWLVSNGYPMPDEVLAARRMGDQELRQLAVQGNIKAGMFYVDRGASTVGFPPTGSEATPELILAGGEWRQIEEKVVASGSPFSGYIVAKARLNHRNGVGAVAGYQLAVFLGDTRASAAISSTTSDNIDAGGELAIYSLLLTQLNKGVDVSRLLSAHANRFPPEP